MVALGLVVGHYGSHMTTGPLFTPESVLAAAFGDHDFIGQVNEQEVVIRTSEPIIDGGPHRDRSRG